MVKVCQKLLITGVEVSDGDCWWRVPISSGWVAFLGFVGLYLEKQCSFLELQFNQNVCCPQQTLNKGFQLGSYCWRVSHTWGWLYQAKRFVCAWVAVEKHKWEGGELTSFSGTHNRHHADLWGKSVFESRKPLKLNQMGEWEHLNSAWLAHKVCCTL